MHPGSIPGEASTAFLGLIHFGRLSRLLTGMDRSSMHGSSELLAYFGESCCVHAKPFLVTTVEESKLGAG